jgi:Fur family ferric uptake transcriptional regulator
LSRDIKRTFVEYLKKKAHRITNERFLILDSAVSMNTHFDADELYLKMKNEYVNVSRATVYKTLELMSECGILSKHNFKGDRTRYEKKFGRNMHYHLICTLCNRIFEFENPVIEKIQDKICKENNFKNVDHTFQVFARCENTESCKFKEESDFSLR